MTQKMPQASPSVPVTRNPPQVGQGATLVYPEDRYPYIIIGVSPSGHRITLQEVQAKAVAPADTHNGFPVFDHVYSEAELAQAELLKRTVTATRRRDGSYYVGGSKMEIGQARYYRDYSS